MKKRARLLVTGASGFLGARLVLEARRRGWFAFGASRSPWEEDGAVQADLARRGEGERLLEEVRPEAVIHGAAMSRIPDCEKDPELAARVNRDGTGELARAAARRDLPFLYVSTDHVFDGNSAPYGPEDPPSPVSVYGRTKVEGEEAVRP